MKDYVFGVVVSMNIHVFAENEDQAREMCLNGVKREEDGGFGIYLEDWGQIYIGDTYECEVEEDELNSVSIDPENLFYALIEDTKVIEILNKYGVVSPYDRFIYFSVDVTYKDVEIVKANFANVSKAAKVVYGTELIGVRVCGD